MSKAREEQDVIAIFHELVGADVLRGLKFFGTMVNERYDGLFELSYTDKSAHHWSTENPLGVRRDIDLPYESEPKVIEFKYDFDALLRDFEKQIKFPKQISFVVCWQASGDYKKKFVLQPLLTDGVESNRVFFGSTHAAYLPDYRERVFEVIILEDLVGYLTDKESTLAYLKTKYPSS